MVKLDDLRKYIEYSGGVGLDVWAMRNAAKTGTKLNLPWLMVECSTVCENKYYVVSSFNKKFRGWDKIAIGMVGYSPSKFSLCGRRGGDELFELITKLRFLGIDISMSTRNEEWEDVYFMGIPFNRSLRHSWMDTPVETYGPLE